MQSLSFNVGVESEDSYFIKSGLSEYREIGGQVFRRCSKAFALWLPGGTDGSATVRLRMLFWEPAITLTLSVGGRDLATIQADNTAWNDYSVEMPGDAPSDDNGLIEVRGELSDDPFYPPAGKIGICDRVVGLCHVTVEADRGELDVPDWCRRDRTEVKPLALKQLGWRPFGEKTAPDREILFGDVHVHTNYSPCGYPNNGTMDENVRIAKDRGHDFVAFADHGEFMSQATWDAYFDEIRELSARHDFIILPAIEYTSRAWGHRNAYFRDTETNPPLFNYFIFETQHPAKLRPFFDKHGVDAFLVPHHLPYESQPGDITSIAPDVEPLIEVYSGWGSSEHHHAPLQDHAKTMPGCYVQDALARGLKLGFVGGSDAHNGAPGDCAVTAVLVEERSVAGIYDALKSRLCYATTGVPVHLDFTVNGFPMGTVLSVNQYDGDKLFPIEIKAEAMGTAPLDRLEIIANGAVIETQLHRLENNRMQIGFELGRLATRTRVNTFRQHLVNYDRWLYARVTQSDGNMAWSSPIWIDYRPNWE